MVLRTPETNPMATQPTSEKGPFLDSAVDKEIKEDAQSYVFSPTRAAYAAYKHECDTLPTIQAKPKEVVSETFRKMDSAYREYIGKIEHPGMSALAQLLENCYRIPGHLKTPTTEEIISKGIEITERINGMGQAKPDEINTYVAQMLMEYEATSWPVFAKIIAIKSGHQYPVDAGSINIKMADYMKALAKIAEPRIQRLSQ